MKKIFTVVLLAGITSLGYSQTNDYPTFGNPTIYNYSPLIILKRSTSEGGFIQGVQTQLSDGTNNWFFGNNHTDYWSVSKGDYQNPKLVVLTNGNTGIGTSTPEALFHVMKSNQLGDVRIGGGNGSGNGRIFIQANMVANDSYIDVYGDNTYKKLSIEARPLVLNRHSQANVGIGTDEPTNALTLRRTALGTSNDVGIDFSVTNGPYYPVYARIALGVSNATQDQGTGYLAFSTLKSGALSESMRIDPTGNVGVGTTDTKGYKLAVAGNMIAESVKVKLQGAWPDYVFTPAYKVPTLQETERYIKEQGHLPGIPSASEVRANGVDLGDMNAKLLQKIEELTLHLIEKDKKIVNLEGRLEKIEALINK